VDLVDVIKANNSQMCGDIQDLYSTRIEVVSALADARHCDMLCEPSCHRSLQPPPKPCELVYEEGKCECTKETSCKGSVKVHDVNISHRNRRGDLLYMLRIRYNDVHPCPNVWGSVWDVAKTAPHDGPLESPDQSLNKGAFLLKSRATILILFVSGKYIPASNVPSTLLVMAFSIIVSVARLSVP
jgi:hypothetical protein